jgi:hypothetical protein
MAPPELRHCAGCDYVRPASSSCSGRSNRVVSNPEKASSKPFSAMVRYTARQVVTMALYLKYSHAPSCVVSPFTLPIGRRVRRISALQSLEPNRPAIGGTRQWRSQSRFFLKLNLFCCHHMPNQTPSMSYYYKIQGARRWTAPCTAYSRMEGK